VAYQKSRHFPAYHLLEIFFFELRMAADVVGNVDKLWAEICQCWYDFIQNDAIVDAVTTGYLWVDLTNIAEEYSLKK
jgi:hypothetical protein